MIAEISETFRGWSALAAAVLSALLFLYVVVRSPRNLFSTLMAGLTLSVCIWNLFEGYRLLTDEKNWPQCFMYVGISFVPAILFHFALSFLRPRRRLRLLVILIYGCAGILSVISLAALNSEQIMDFINVRDLVCYNGLLLLVMGPVMVAAVLIFAVRFFTESKRMRGIYGWMLLAALIGVPAGITDLMEGMELPGLKIANLGAFVASGALLIGVLRNREFFDALSRYREETHRLLSETRHGLVTVNGGGRVLTINEAGIRLLGGRPDSLAEIDEGLSELARVGGEIFVPKAGRVLKATMWPDVVRGCSPPHYLLLEDNTREYELLHELAQRQSLVLLGEAAATLAHEIKNPLTAISASAEALAQEGTSDLEMLGILRGEVRRLDKLVTQSLDLARPLKVTPEEVDLNDLMKRILGQVPSTAELEFLPAGALKDVRVDPALLKQVIDNLVRNADQAGAGNIQVRTRAAGEQVVIEVENDGPTIPPEVKGRLFLPFVTTRSDGTGLGLAVCSKIARAHGGVIRAENTDHGVCFEMRLPWTC